ncbi:DNA repair protein RecO [Parablautia muri]|uniref:DNA repair protein RecO n=1 Tax=Parablautia muri TaxID=2320879 RepID=A0A9X5GRY8_9FIRM|nr:DNA repair protein RecO [Parablautia muri]
MQEQSSVTGIILKAEPIGEYDRRVVILTRERGKIAAFARGARKQGSRLLASTNPFCFGQFRLYEGRSAYGIAETSISNYFEGFRGDFEAACYGMYFLEMMDYYTRENSDEMEMLKLLYQSLRALLHEGLSNQLIRYIFEIRALSINGEYPGLPDRERPYLPGTVYAANYIVDSSIEKLYTFTVTRQVLAELSEITESYRKRFMDRKMKSLEILSEIQC